MLKKLFYILLLVPALALPLEGFGQTAQPVAVLSWKAKTYVPSSYQGKILPGSTTPLLASLDIFMSGKAVNLSGYKIYWYLNNTLIDRGVGLQSVSIRTPQTLGGGSITLRAQIPDFSSGSLVKSVSIPLVSPSIVIENPSGPSELFSKTLRLKIVPYFFTVSDLSSLKFNWSVGGIEVKAAEDPQNLIINTNPDAAPGAALSVSATVSNPAGYFESASAQKSFTLSN
ncbi:MAG: hypothetical protein LiPW15_798 [Parcubacteria group bacterium LiPW_15]|nr:MAG: hypothetical protein LiPW15_798 [Parcubacteria group bacterium LiPW_15]